MATYTQHIFSVSFSFSLPSRELVRNFFYSIMLIFVLSVDIFHDTVDIVSAGDTVQALIKLDTILILCCYQSIRVYDGGV